MADAAPARTERLQSIQEVSDELGITSRALRFYEDKGLIEPDRAGTMRVYSKREIARVRLILRGKKLGFSLKLIKQFLDLYDYDPKHVEQMRALIAVCDERTDELEQQKLALDETIDEVAALRAQAVEHIETALKR